VHKRLAEFLRRTPADHGFDEFAPVFADVFGEPLETAMAEFSDYPNCSEMSNRIAIVDCNLPPGPWDDGTLRLTAHVACDQDDVLGPHSDGRMFTTRGFEIEAPGEYLVSASEPPGASQFRLVKCASCWDGIDEVITPGAMERHALTPGRYYTVFSRPADAPAELGLVLERL